MEKQETVADIIVEMRDLGKLDEKSVDKIPRTLMALGLRTYADRFEAAWKREKASIEADALAVGGMAEASRATAEKSSVVGDTSAEQEAVTVSHRLGDCAKLREALKSCVDEMCDRCREMAAARGNPLPCLSGCKPVHKAKAALAKPPRNFDMYGGDYRMLHTAWFDWTGSPSGQNPDGTVKLTFSEWLLEKAVRHDI